jgi:hypothetical protein
LLQASAARIFSINPGPHDSFLARALSGSISRQNGVMASGGAPAAFASSAASATILQNIPVVSGHVPSAPFGFARDARKLATLRVSPCGIASIKIFTSFGVDSRTLAPGRNPANGFSNIVIDAGLLCFSSFSVHDFLYLAIKLLLSDQCVQKPIIYPGKLKVGQSVCAVLVRFSGF